MELEQMKQLVDAIAAVGGMPAIEIAAACLEALIADDDDRLEQIRATIAADGYMTCYCELLAERLFA